ncbi:hypothetical protein OESDEN_17115 [Oesophagostomum dentatum]|uniref:Uncharacterized protein n=1 Tax=Oesophagostomum dentatum TaxID=61180 RepID=A0A0B1SD35_OESDE|nr:hypothetical protein OESDEN_17115 [Oesophagostomum dentatum]
MIPPPKLAIEWRETDFFLKILNSILPTHFLLFQHREQHGGRPRFLSVGNVGEEVSSNPAGGVVRRSSAGVRRRERPTSLIEFVKQRMSPSRRNEVITEEEEDAQQLGRKQSIRSTQSERLQIQIVITEEEEEAQQLGRKQSIRSTQSERLQIQIV